MTGGNTTLVQLDHVTKRFDDVVAVDDLDIAISAGQFVTLLGPSGCGKSTTLRMLGGFESPDTGRILLDGTDVTRVPPNRRNVNMVFQDYALFPHMSVRRNIAFGLELKGQTRQQIDDRIATLLELLSLEDLDARMPDQLSGGQRQRVALARSLAPDPKVLLLDEPLGALDAKLRGQVQVELKSIQKRTGKTFIFVTHDQEEALTMSDRIVVMNKGRIEQDGTPEALYHRPESRFVADFIGESNLIRCTVSGIEKDSIVLDWAGLSLRAAAPQHRPQPGSTVEAAVRPESINVTARQPKGTNALKGRMVNRLFKGSRTLIDIEVGDSGSTVLQATLDPMAAERLGEGSLWLSWPEERMSVLRD